MTVYDYGLHLQNHFWTSGHFYIVGTLHLGTLHLCTLHLGTLHVESRIRMFFISLLVPVFGLISNDFIEQPRYRLSPRYHCLIIIKTLFWFFCRADMKTTALHFVTYTQSPYWYHPVDLFSYLDCSRLVNG